MLESASAFVRQKYTEERLIHNIETLYRNLILRIHQT